MGKVPAFFALYSAVHRPLTNGMNDILVKYDLTSSYWRLLRLLEDGEVRNYREITKTLNIEKPAVTKLFKKLVQLEMVDIQEGQDKREKMVKISPHGKEKMSEIRAELNPFLESLLEDLSEEQLEIAVEVMEVILAKMIRK